VPAGPAGRRVSGQDIRIVSRALRENLADVDWELIRALGEINQLLTTLYVVDYAEGWQGRDIREHILDAARSVRAALAVQAVVDPAALERPARIGG
jgi:hypothetical protein